MDLGCIHTPVKCQGLLCTNHTGPVAAVHPAQKSSSGNMSFTGKLMTSKYLSNLCPDYVTDKTDTVCAAFDTPLSQSK